MVEHEAEEVLQSALELPLQERARIAEKLISSLDTEFDEGVERAWQTEIQRRLGEIDRGEVVCIPWEEVRDRLKRQRGAA